MKSRSRTAPSDPLLHFLLRGGFASFTTRVIGVSLSYVAAILLSRSIGVQGYGAYSIALGWALVLVLPSRAGLDYAALSFAAIYVEERSIARLRAFARFSAVAILCLSIVTGTIIYFLTMAGLTSAPRGLAPGIALLIFPVAALGLVAALLRTVRRIVASQFYEQILRPAVLVAMLAAALLAGIRLSAATAMILTGASAFAALFFGAAHVVRVLGAARGPADYGPWRDWLALSFPLLLTTIVQEILNQLDIIMLGYLDTAAAAGLYSAAWRLSALVSFGLTALATISGPLIASAHARNDQGELARIARITARFGFAASLCLSLPLVLAGRHILQLFGPEFGSGYPALLILLVGGLTNAFTGSVAYFLTLTGKHVQAFWIFGGALTLSAALNLLLIPHYSIVGAAIASSAATIFWNVAMLIYVRRQLGIDASALALSPRGAIDH